MSEAEAVIVTGSDEASISSSFQILKFKMEAGGGPESWGLARLISASATATDSAHHKLSSKTDSQQLNRELLNSLLARKNPGFLQT